MTKSTDTTVDEIADDIFRISTRFPDLMPGGFTMNQFLIRDESSLLFHTGTRGLFPRIRDAVKTVVAPERVRYVAFSHLESDECGAINEWLALCPHARPACSRVGAFVFLGDSADRPAVGLADGESLSLGHHTVRWLDAPHVPHGEDCGYLFEERSRTLLCGDLFAQPGADLPAVTTGDIFAPSEAMRAEFPYAPVRNAREVLDKLAATEPALLACMHGASFRGDCGALLRRLGAALALGS